jgi:hypothetical protein
VCLAEVESMRNCHGLKDMAFVVVDSPAYLIALRGLPEISECLTCSNYAFELVGTDGLSLKRLVEAGSCKRFECLYILRCELR